MSTPALHWLLPPALHSPDTTRALALGAPAAPDFGAHAVLALLGADTFVSSCACALSAPDSEAIGTADTRSLGALAVDAALRPASVIYSLQRGDVFPGCSPRQTTFQI